MPIALLLVAQSGQERASTDMASLGQAAAAALGGDFRFDVEPSRLLLSCGKCRDDVVIDITIGKAADDTERRIRSGATTIADIERICRIRDDACRITRLELGSAVGWISAYSQGGRDGATAVIMDGRLVTVRATSTRPGAARAAIDRLLPLMQYKLVGR